MAKNSCNFISWFTERCIRSIKQRTPITFAVFFINTIYMCIHIYAYTVDFSLLHIHTFTYSRFQIISYMQIYAQTHSHTCIHTWINIQFISFNCIPSNCIIRIIARLCKAPFNIKFILNRLVDCLCKYIKFHLSAGFSLLFVSFRFQIIIKKFSAV